MATALEALKKQVREYYDQYPTWWGYHPVHGLVVLNWNHPTNKDCKGPTKIFRRCSDWTEHEVPNDQWGPPFFVLYWKHIELISDAIERENAIRELGDYLTKAKHAYDDEIRHKKMEEIIKQKKAWEEEQERRKKLPLEERLAIELGRRRHLDLVIIFTTHLLRYIGVDETEECCYNCATPPPSRSLTFFSFNHDSVDRRVGFGPVCFKEFIAKCEKALSFIDESSNEHALLKRNIDRLTSRSNIF